MTKQDKQYVTQYLAKTLPLMIIAPMLVFACAKKHTGDEFIGTWRAQGDKAPENQTVYIADRLIIEKDTSKANGYNAALLAQGVFTAMEYNSDKGFLCSKKGACFELVDKDHVRIGSQNGIKTYEREK